MSKQQPKQQQDATAVDTSTKKVFVVAGRSNTGKTTIVRRLAGLKGITEKKFQNTNVVLEYGDFSGTDALLINTPGNNFTFTDNEDELIIRKVLFETNVKGIIFIADAKALAKSLALYFYYTEFGLPIYFNVNMVDEAAIRGVTINFEKLSSILNVAVNSTVAIESAGVANIKKIATGTIPKANAIRYSEPIENYLCSFAKLVPGNIPGNLKDRRILALSMLIGDELSRNVIIKDCAEASLKRIDDLILETRKGLGLTNIPHLLSNIYLSEAEKIVKQVVSVSEEIKIPFMDKLGLYCINLPTGIPIAFVVFAFIYLFVGQFGANFLVTLFQDKFFGGIVNPFLFGIISHIPSPFVQEMFIGKYGILSVGITLALGIVLPVLLTFYLALGVLESSGYLTRLTILFERVLKRLGMTGKGIIPLLLGFSCITAALITTRMLDGKKERLIASILLVLGIPCAPLLGVALVLLAKMSWVGYVLFFGVIFTQIIVAGLILNRFIKGPGGVFLFEIPPMRLPRVRSVVSGAIRRTNAFLVEALPVFVIATFVMFIVDKLGGIALVGRALRPLLVNFIGLPIESVSVFLMAMIRRESGIALLSKYADSHIFSNVQILINLLLLSFCVPCINAMITLIKERGAKVAISVLCFTLPYAVLLGGFLNWIINYLKITI